MGFGNNVFLDIVIIVICCIYICVFRYFIDICGFLANIDEGSPFLFRYFYL